MTEDKVTVSVKVPAGGYKKVAPEGGWGYVVAIGQSIVFFVILGPLQCFGLIYADFFQSIGGRTSDITLCYSAFFTSYSSTGLLANALFKKYSCRQVGLAGAILYTIGSFLTVFVTSLGQMMLTYSLLEGIGYGLMVPATLTGFNSYFVQKRAFMFLATKPLIGTLTMCFPLVIYGLLEVYGFRGMLAVLTAINAHSIVGMMTLQPVEWHLKLVAVDQEMEKTTNGNAQEDNKLITKPQMTNVVSSARLHKSESQVKIPHLSSILDISEVDKIACPRQRTDSVMSRRSGRGNFSIGEDLQEEDCDEELSVQNSVVEEELADKTKKTFKQKIIDFFDLTLLKDLKYVNIWLGISFSEFASLTFNTLLPVHLAALGWTRGEIAMCLFAGGIADLTARISLLVVNPFLKVTSRTNYLMAALFTVFARTLFLTKTDFSSVVATVVMALFCRTWMLVNIALTFAEYAPPERFPAAYGLYMFLQGSISLLLGPLAGYIRDVTGSYIICFHALMACHLVCVIPWAAEVAWTILKKRRRIEECK